MDVNQYPVRVVNPSYWLVSNGFIRLGVSKWESDNAYGGGIPQRELAIAYAQAIGANVVIYATHDMLQTNKIIPLTIETGSLVLKTGNN